MSGAVLRPYQEIEPQAAPAPYEPATPRTFPGYTAPPPAIDLSAMAWIQDSLAARTLEDVADRLRMFGALRPPEQPGYNAYTHSDLSRYGDSLGMFKDDRSPEETEYSKRRADMLRERGRTLDEHAGMSRFLAGMLTLEGLATWRVNTVVQGASRGASAVRSGLATGAFGAGMTAAQDVGAANTMPGELRQDLLTSTLFSGAFGGILGAGFGAAFGGKSANAARDGYMQAHRAQDGPMYDSYRTLFPGDESPLADFLGDRAQRRPPPSPEPTPEAGAGAPSRPGPVVVTEPPAPRPGAAPEPPAAPPGPRLDVEAHVNAISPQEIELNDGVTWRTERPVRLGEMQVPDLALQQQVLHVANYDEWFGRSHAADYTEVTPEQAELYRKQGLVVRETPARPATDLAAYSAEPAPSIPGLLARGPDEDPMLLDDSEVERLEERMNVRLQRVTVDDIAPDKVDAYEHWLEEFYDKNPDSGQVYWIDKSTLSAQPAKFEVAGKPVTTFHGTQAAYDRPSNAMLGTSTGAASAGQGHFAAGTDKTASAYVAPDPEFAGEGQHGGNIRPQQMLLRNPLIHDFDYDSFRDVTYSDLLKRAKAEGRDGAIFKNTFDGTDTADTIYVVFDPAQIRSPWEVVKGAEVEIPASGFKDFLAKTEGPAVFAANDNGTISPVRVPEADRAALAAGGAPPGGPGVPPGGVPPGPPPHGPIVPAPGGDPYRFGPRSGARLFHWGGLPFYKIINNEFSGIVGSNLAKTALEMVQTPGIYLTGMDMNVAAPTASIDALSAVRHGARFAVAVNEMDQAFFTHAGWDPNTAGPFTTRAAELLDMAGNAMGRQRLKLDANGNAVQRMTYEQFEHQVMRALADPASTTDADVLRAAAVWREKFLDPMASEAAAAGVLLTPDHNIEASASIAMQRQTIAQLDAELASLGMANNHPSRQYLTEWREALDARQRVADDMALETRRPYVPQKWQHRKVREGRDELVQIIADHWTSGQSLKPQQMWASPAIRAEIAVGNILKAGPAEQLERVIRTHLMAGGMGDNQATVLAAQHAAQVKAMIASVDTKPLTREWNALTNQWNDGIDGYAFVQAEVERALRAAGYPDPPPELIEAIAPSEIRSKHDRGLPGHAHERTIDAPFALIEDFLDTSLRNVMADYARLMGPAIETGRKFGDPSMAGELMRQQIAMLKETIKGNGTLAEALAVNQALTDLRDKMIGRFSAPENASAWSVRTVRLLQSSAVLTQMGSSLVSNLTDVGRVVMEHGFGPVFEVAKMMITDGEGWRLGSQEMRLAGAASEMVNLNRSKSMNDIQFAGGDISLLERWYHALAENMMVLNGLAPFTQNLQQFAGILTAHFMMDWAMLMERGAASPEQIKKLLAYGIDAQMATDMVRNYRAAGEHVRPGSGLRLMNTEQWADRELVDRVNAAIKTAVDQQVVKSGNADRPNFMSAPLAQGIFMYKSFAIAATQRTLMAGLQRRDMLVMQGMIASIAIAYFFADPPGGEHDKSPILNSARFAQAIEKSGALGILSDINNYVEMATQNSFGIRPAFGIRPPVYARDTSRFGQLAQTLGPAAQPWMMAARSWFDPDAKADQVSGDTRRLIPFNNLIYVRETAGQIARQAADLFKAAPAPREARQ
jgi:hypothetical protein